MGKELKNLTKYADTLQVLKLASNKIATFDDVSSLATLKCLRNLDLENNPITKLAGYKDHMFKLIPTLELLDGYDKEGEEVFSEDDDDDIDDYGEEGEEDHDGFID